MRTDAVKVAVVPAGMSFRDIERQWIAGVDDGAGATVLPT
jgi:hypothetical protein